MYLYKYELKHLVSKPLQEEENKTSSKMCVLPRNTSHSRQRPSLVTLLAVSKCLDGFWIDFSYYTVRVVCTTRGILRSSSSAANLRKGSPAFTKDIWKRYRVTRYCTIVIQVHGKRLFVTHTVRNIKLTTIH